jgi:hypothetical protein
MGKANSWPSFDEKWLLLHLGEGGPFGDLVATSQHPVSGAEKQLRDHTEKVLFEICSILAVSHPFDYVLIFVGCQVIAFPSNGRNRYKLPMPRWDLVARGARVEDSHLDWTSTLKHITRTGECALHGSDAIYEIADCQRRAGE